MPDDPVARLGNTHRRMQEELRALEMAAQSGNRQALDLGLEFFATAAVRHHQDEEASLFPRLRGDAGLVALLDALTAEHLAQEDARREIEAFVRDDAGEAEVAASVARSGAALAAPLIGVLMVARIGESTLDCSLSNTTRQAL